MEEFTVREYLSPGYFLWRHSHTSLSAKSSESQAGISLANLQKAEGGLGIYCRNQKTEGRQ
jgi:hypothetical protein